MSLCLCHCPLIFRSLPLSTSLFICFSICLYISLYICLFICLFISLSICLSTFSHFYYLCPPLYSSFPNSIYPPIHLLTLPFRSLHYPLYLSPSLSASISLPTSLLYLCLFCMSLESSHIAHAQNRSGLGCHGLLHGRNAVSPPAPARPSITTPFSKQLTCQIQLLLFASSSSSSSSSNCCCCCGQEVVPVSIGC